MDLGVPGGQRHERGRAAARLTSPKARQNVRSVNQVAWPDGLVRSTVVPERRPFWPSTEPSCRVPTVFPEETVP